MCLRATIRFREASAVSGFRSLTRGQPAIEQRFDASSLAVGFARFGASRFMRMPKRMKLSAEAAFSRGVAARAR